MAKPDQYCCKMRWALNSSLELNTKLTSSSPLKKQSTQLLLSFCHFFLSLSYHPNILFSKQLTLNRKAPATLIQ